MAEVQAKYVEKRRARRARLTLRGRCLLSDGSEHPCKVIDVSTTGMALSAYVLPDVGERIVAYIDELGRFEGDVVRRGGDWFAIDASAPLNRSGRLGQKLAVLSGDQSHSVVATQEPKSRRAELRTEFGQSFIVRIFDETRFSARIVTNSRLLPGARVTVDSRSAVVARQVGDGFVIQYS